MAAFIIDGGHPLSGTITPQGAKNEALEVICATLLTPEKVVIENIPDIRDVNNLIMLLKDIGGKSPNFCHARSLSISPVWLMPASRRATCVCSSRSHTDSGTPICEL